MFLLWQLVQRNLSVQGFRSLMTACSAALLFFHGAALAADVRLKNRYTFDGMTNGNIDADVVLAANVADESRMICNVMFQGIIEAVDADKLKAILQKMSDEQKGRVCFDSPGGSFAEGIKVAELLAVEGVGTGIESGATCLSACALAFMGGRVPFGGIGTGQLNRFLHVRGALGFHAPFVGGSASSQDVVPAAKLVEAYNAAVRAVNQLVKLG